MENRPKRPIFGDSFHGETWYKCPQCGEAYEFYDTVFERGFEKTDETGIVKHKCGCLIDTR